MHLRRSEDSSMMKIYELYDHDSRVYDSVTAAR